MVSLEIVVYAMLSIALLVTLLEQVAELCHIFLKKATTERVAQIFVFASAAADQKEDVLECMMMSTEGATAW